jgi:outer membrane protein TolC
VICRPSFLYAALIFFAAFLAGAQSVPTITLQEALQRAHQYGAQVQSADFAVGLAKEDRVQARADLLPSVSALNQFIYTEGNGTPSGVFVANDGVHVYNEQAIVHQDLLNVTRRATLRRAHALEAVAQAKRDVAIRGLNLTVTSDYYAAVSALRKSTNAQASLDDAQRFLEITRKLEQGGEAAHADTIKAQITAQQRQRDLMDAQLAVEKAKITLAVLIFPDVTRDFNTVDDLDHSPPLEDFATVDSQSRSASPEVRAARSNVLVSRDETNIARYAYVPSLAIDFFYGIDANQFTDVSSEAQATGRSTLPHSLVSNRHNLGYSGQVTLTIPVWNWGSTQSRVKQARIREKQTQLDLGLAEKQLHADIGNAYLEAQSAEAQIASLRDSANLSAESLRLTLLRYQAGDATVLEVVDAQTTLAVSRNAYADGLVRYRVAVATIQSLTGRL